MIKCPWRNPPECSLTEPCSSTPRGAHSAASGVQAPVDGVEEQVGQWEGQPGVRVDHVAVADQQVHVLPHRALPAQASPLCGPDVWGLGRRGEGVRGQSGSDAGERSQLNVIVMETAVEGHRLAGVEGRWDLKQNREKTEAEDMLSRQTQLQNHLWVSAGLCRSLWVSVGVCGSLWVSVGLCGSL